MNERFGAGLRTALVFRKLLLLLLLLPDIQLNSNRFNLKNNINKRRMKY